MGVGLKRPKVSHQVSQGGGAPLTEPGLAQSKRRRPGILLSETKSLDLFFYHCILVFEEK